MAKVDGRLRVTGRDAQDYTERYPELGVLLDLPDSTVLDGELVLLREPCFVEAVHYVAFDLLYLAGQSLMARPLSARRAALAEVLPEHEYVSRCEGVIGKGTRFFAKMLAAGHEGLVAKRLTSTYTPNRRSDAWQKIKERLELPCVVIGYKVVRQELRALLMATLVEGKLAYVGAVELGTEGVRLADLDRLARRRPVVPCDFKAKWLEPRLLCVVRFAGWRPSGAWRDPVVARWEWQPSRAILIAPHPNAENPMKAVHVAAASAGKVKLPEERGSEVWLANDSLTGASLSVIRLSLRPGQSGGKHRHPTQTR